MYNSKFPGRKAAVVLLVVVAAGCQSVPNASYDFAVDAEFDSYQTFSWVSDRPLRFHADMDAHTSPMLEQHLKDAALSAFSEAGLRYVDDVQQADLVMAFTVGSRETVSDSGYFGYYGPAISGDYTNSGYWIDGGRSFRRVTDGQVCVDLFERRSQQPVWHGMAEENLNDDELEYWRTRVPVIMNTIAAGYPPE